MALWLVNETPLSDLLKPSGLVQFSMKSDVGRPRLGTLMAKFGISRLLHNKLMPEADSNLKKYGEVIYTSPERAVPYTGECRKSINTGRIVITKQTDDTADLGVYEYKVPADAASSSLSYFKIRKHAWQVGVRPWIAADNVTGLRFGLISGLLMTSCDLFLRDDGLDGTLIVAGPIDGASRSHEVEYYFPWKTVAEDSTIELWIHSNNSSGSPTFDVWGRIGSGETLRIASVARENLGTNASSVQNFVTTYFGNGGFSGDVLDVEDWAFYPDFRDAVSAADALPGNSIIIVPDAPTTYRADSWKLPTESSPARWFPFGKVKADFGFDLGRRAIPQSVVIDKYELVEDQKVPYTGRAGFERREPRLAQNQGFMVEALMSGFASHVDVEAFGAGIGVRNGVYAYRALFYKAATRNAVVLQSNGETSSLAEQHDSGRLIDWETMRLIRLAMDPNRQTVSLWVDDELVVSKPLGRIYPKSNRPAGVEFGHLLDVATMGQVSVGFVNYLTKYQSYEASDGVTPNTAPLNFTRRMNGDGRWDLDNGVLQITKKDFHVQNTRYDYFHEDSLDVSSGALVDFRARVPMFWDMKGTPMAASSTTGVGLKLHLGSKVFYLGFYNCGVHGKFIGVLPGSGTSNDIVEQTALGRQFSAQVDWTKMETYRVVLRAYDRIEIWAGKTTNKPAIVLPWRNDTDGFDLPVEKQGQASGISFGHSDGMTASISEWDFVRWGTSSGYDIAISQGYQNGLREDQYGGKSLLMTDIDEDI